MVMKIRRSAAILKKDGTIQLLPNFRSQIRTPRNRNLPERKLTPTQQIEVEPKNTETPFFKKSRHPLEVAFLKESELPEGETLKGVEHAYNRAPQKGETLDLHTHVNIKRVYKKKHQIFPGPTDIIKNIEQINGREKSDLRLFGISIRNPKGKVLGYMFYKIPKKIAGEYMSASRAMPRKPEERKTPTEIRIGEIDDRFQSYKRTYFEWHDALKRGNKNQIAQKFAQMEAALKKLGITIKIVPNKKAGVLLDRTLGQFREKTFFEKTRERIKSD